MRASEHRGDRGGRLAAKFTALLALPERRRGDYLRALRTEDPWLGAELESLLCAARASCRFLEPGTGRAAAVKAAGRALARGMRVGCWRIVRRIGSGGMSDVYEARSGSGATGALKLTRSEGIADAVREARLLQWLAHPAVPAVLDAGQCSAGNYCVLELIDGRPITEHCDRNDSGTEQRLALFVQLCAAVAHAHERGIVHRDVKPANVLIDAAGRARLIDFGIAAVVGQRSPAAADARPTWGTPDYASPEQLAGAAAAPTDDVHALGVLLFELLVGCRPWPKRRGPFAAALSSVRVGRAPRASAAAARRGDRCRSTPALRSGLDRIIAKCLAEQPEQRYASAAALVRELERFAPGAHGPIVELSGAQVTA